MESVEPSLPADQGGTVQCSKHWAYTKSIQRLRRSWTYWSHCTFCLHRRELISTLGLFCPLLRMVCWFGARVVKCFSQTWNLYMCLHRVIQKVAIFYSLTSYGRLWITLELWFVYLIRRCQQFQKMRGLPRTSQWFLWWHSLEMQVSFPHQSVFGKPHTCTSCVPFLPHWPFLATCPLPPQHFAGIHQMNLLWQWCLPRLLFYFCLLSWKKTCF